MLARATLAQKLAQVQALVSPRPFSGRGRLPSVPGYRGHAASPISEERASQASTRARSFSSLAVTRLRDELVPARGRGRRERESPTRMRTIVRTAGGACCEISPSDHWTCYDLKRHVEAELGVPASQQRLIHGSGPLEEAMRSAAVETLGELLSPEAGQATSLELLLYVRSTEAAQMIWAVKQDGFALEDASEELKVDREIVMEAVKHNGWALRYASDELKGDKEVVMEAIKKHGYALEHASEELKGDREVVMEAVKKHGHALRYASEELTGDKEVVMEAVKERGEALMHASEELKGDKEVVMEAVKQSVLVLRCASVELQGDREVVMAAVKQDGLASCLRIPPRN